MFQKTLPPWKNDRPAMFFHTRRITPLVRRIGYLICFVVIFSSSTRLQHFVQCETIDREKEYSIKCALLIKLFTYIDWTNRSTSSAPNEFVLNILGDDPFGPILDDLAQKHTVNDCKIIVHRITTLNPDQIPDALFISRSEESKLEQIFAQIKDWKTLTISEMDGFAEKGGIINFFIESNTIRFEINVTAAQKSNIKIDAQVLALKKVRVIRQEGNGV